jgi:amino acid adenylation domain-containing protein
MSAAEFISGTYAQKKTTVPGLVCQQIQRRPRAVAIVAGGRELTYAQLGILAEKVRWTLARAGTKRGDIVALCIPPSAEFVAAALAIMSAGAVYFPIDESCPAERLFFMLEDSGARLLITTSHVSPVARSSTSARIIEIDQIQDPDSVATLSEDAEIDDPNLAYLIYTSGSTGQPKGVEITHGGLSNLIAWHNRAFDIAPNDRASQIARLSFDAAVWEIWPYLAAGATLCVPGTNVRQDPRELQQWFVSERITVAFAPTILAQQLTQLEWPRRTALRLLLTGGDALRVYPRSGLPFRLINNYGPTECTVVATSGAVRPDETSCAPPPIGRPIYGVEIHIVGEDLKPLKPGQAGELCIGGQSLARGYRNRPELTAQKFIADPFRAAPGARLYRTGDLARAREDGQIEFIGRIDDQVKIRGYRVEPNEVAVAILNYSAVAECVVAARDMPDGEQQLIAYIVPAGTVPLSQPALREFIAKKLPDYMIPSLFVTLQELPLTANGKIDYAALPAPERMNAPGINAPVLPRTALEQRIAAIVCKLLKLESVGVEDNFFVLGGHSLFGAQLIARLSKHFKVDVPLRALFEAPTIASLAAQVTRLQSERHAAKVT